MLKTMVFIIVVILCTNQMMSQIKTQFFIAFTMPDYSETFSHNKSIVLPGGFTGTESLVLSFKDKKPGISGGMVMKYPNGTGFEIRADLVRVRGKSEGEIQLTGSTTVKKESFSHDNELDMVPVSFNIRLEFLDFDQFRFFLSTGLTVFVGKYSAAAALVNRKLPEDSIEAPLNVEQTWSGFYKIRKNFIKFGGNIGGGFEFDVLKSVSVFGEARYFLGGKKSFTWIREVDSADKVTGAAELVTTYYHIAGGLLFSF